MKLAIIPKTATINNDPFLSQAEIAIDLEVWQDGNKRTARTRLCFGVPHRIAREWLEENYPGLKQLQAG